MHTALTLLLCTLALALTAALLRYLTGPLLPERESDLARLRAIRSRQAAREAGEQA
ncbi:hypothetical protein [Nocardiopsis sp. MG754419]|uniref:hypothetical protein n=1 Tax=Nocardiopsis sp. MG754419 TaxID=2259865 RepID=UPI001BADFD57|nr:hypothetical protein [Nocardiopsis sp. MG754419]